MDLLNMDSDHRALPDAAKAELEGAMKKSPDEIGGYITIL